MSVQTFLDVFIPHLETIIQWSIFAIVGLGVTWVGLMAFRKSPQQGSSGEAVSAGELEGTLKKILEQTSRQSQFPMKSETKVEEDGEVPSADAVASPGNAEEAQKLKEELKKKEAELKALREDLENNSDSGADDAQSYLTKIKDLEDRLSEYEILEDDIADLSLYKEENARMKKELEELRAGLAASGDEDPQETQSSDATAEPATEEVQASAEEPQEEEAVAEAADEPEPQEEASTEAKGTESQEASEESQDDLLGEFEEAMKEQKEAKTLKEDDAMEEPVDEPEPAASAEADEESGENINEDLLAEFEQATHKKDAVEEAPTTEVEPEASAQEEPLAGEMSQEQDPEEPQVLAGDDLMAEFSGEMDVPSQESSVEAEKGSELVDKASEAAPALDLDTEKVLEEMASLPDVSEEEVDGSALEEDVDTDKMAAEAKKLASGDE